MKLVHQKTNRRTTIDETVDRAQGIQDAANRLVERVWGRDHYARRAAGWNDLPEQFTATVCRVVGDLSQEMGVEWFHVAVD